MHGRLDGSLCSLCGGRAPWKGDLDATSACPVCHEAGFLRPDVVWFGEIPLDMPRIADALRRTTLFLSVGTSGTVYPAAGFVAEAKAAGARTIEVNLEASGNPLFDESLVGNSADTLPSLADRLLSRAC
jgi:NAD-dependent deacetylase